MEIAFSAGEFSIAEEMAKEYLVAAASFPDDWNYGNAIHHANLLLGRVALQQGNISHARQYLMAASATPGSPQLNSFGPNMILGRDLLRLGEKNAVLEYIKACTKFWSLPHAQKLAAGWINQMADGDEPQFGANLLY